MSVSKKAQVKLKRLIKQFRIILAVSIVYIIAGSYFYHLFEDWRWLDSIYFSVVSLTTVGYGDVSPVTDGGKIFTMFYLIFGIAIFGAFINNILKSRVAKRTLKSYEEHIVHSVEDSIEKEFEKQDKPKNIVKRLLRLK
ncbi:MAG: two pore domain potassium channel family protein [Candidatus Nomurabacteria bacterium]|nr:MAG: two pore domain potassium channel family protein [Candidatus Nomurabacteria bacterium]HRV76438.1 potassium channel family protein [Candidatus Saccharimonadales bacterium]